MTVVHVTHDIDEAVYLADRVLVLGSAPGRVVGSIEVGLAATASADATPQLAASSSPSGTRSTTIIAARRPLQSMTNGEPARRALFATSVGAARARRPARWRGSAQTPAAPTTVKIAALPIEPTALAFYAQAQGFFRASRESTRRSR